MVIEVHFTHPESFITVLNSFLERADIHLRPFAQDVLFGLLI
jgi:hypothetical protein